MTSDRQSGRGRGPGAAPGRGPRAVSTKSAASVWGAVAAAAGLVFASCGDGDGAPSPPGVGKSGAAGARAGGNGQGRGGAAAGSGGSTLGASGAGAGGVSGKAAGGGSTSGSGGATQSGGNAGAGMAGAGQSGSAGQEAGAAGATGAGGKPGGGGAAGKSGVGGAAGMPTSGAAGKGGAALGGQAGSGTAGSGTAGSGGGGAPGAGGSEARGRGLPLAPQLVAQNLWYPDSVSTLWPLVQASGVRLVRIGGNAPNKTPPTHAAYMGWVKQVRAIGAEPLVQVSQLVTPTQAADLVTFLNVTQGLGVRFWGIGNEPDLDGVPVGNVGSYVRALASYMKEADPTLQIYAPDTAFYNVGYLGPLLGGAEDISGKDGKGRFYIDGVSFHTYPNPKDGAPYDRARAVASASGVRGNAVALRKLLDAADAKHGRTGGAKLQWGIGEFNITYKNPADNDVGDFAATSFLNGQFFAEVYGIGMQHGARFVAAWSIHESSGARGPLDLGYLDGPLAKARPRASYWHTQLVADHFHGTYAEGTTNQARVKAYGAGDGQTLAVMILNEEQTKGYRFTLRLAAASPASADELDISVDSGLTGQASGDLAAQATVVLVFDGQGKLSKRIDYGIADAVAFVAPH